MYKLSQLAAVKHARLVAFLSHLEPHTIDSIVASNPGVPVKRTHKAQVAAIVRAVEDARPVEGSNL